VTAAARWPPRGRSSRRDAAPHADEGLRVLVTQCDTLAPLSRWKHIDVLRIDGLRTTPSAGGASRLSKRPCSGDARGDRRPPRRVEVETRAAVNIATAHDSASPASARARPRARRAPHGLRNADQLVWRVATALARAGVEPGHVCAPLSRTICCTWPACTRSRASARACTAAQRRFAAGTAAGAQAVGGAVLITDREDTDDAAFGRAPGAGRVVGRRRTGRRVRPCREPAGAVADHHGFRHDRPQQGIRCHHQVTARRIRTRAAGMPMRPGERVMSLSAMDSA